MRCPECGEESFPKKKLITDGWKVTGEIEVCALCDAQWSKSVSPGKEPESKADSSRNRLAALLGGDMPEKVKLSGSADKRFCRNCRYFIIHPFKTLCALSDEETDPMGECKKFSDRD